MTSLIETIYNALDLAFSDHGGPGENVRSDTIRAHGVDLTRAIALLHAEEQIQYSLFRALGPSEPSPQIYVRDFPSDLRASLYVLLGGYYRQAFLCLRSWMEMRLLGIYFALVDRSKFADWMTGETTFRDKLFGLAPIHALFHLPEFRAAHTKHQLEGHLKKVYGEVCVFVHGSGLARHALDSNTDNVPRHNPRAVMMYLDLLREVWTVVTHCLWLAYGEEALRHVGDDTRSTILATLREPFRAELRASIGGL